MHVPSIPSRKVTQINNLVKGAMFLPNGAQNKLGFPMGWKPNLSDSSLMRLFLILTYLPGISGFGPQAISI